VGNREDHFQGNGGSVSRDTRRRSYKVAARTRQLVRSSANGMAPSMSPRAAAMRRARWGLARPNRALDDLQGESGPALGKRDGDGRERRRDAM
jgi:hypothetical protein